MALNSKLLFFITRSVVAALAATTLFNCSGSKMESSTLPQGDTVPSMYARNVVIAESEGGRIKYQLKAPLLEQYENPDGTVIIFPEGMEIQIYDSLEPSKIKTTITADKGINNESKKFMEALNNVVVSNHTLNEVLTTERLVWDQNTKRVYSDRHVTVKRGREVMYGEGMESDERMESWKVIRPTAQMYIND